MKKIAIIVAIAVLAVGCASKVDIKKEIEELDAKVSALYDNTELSEAEIDEQAAVLYEEAYRKHTDDSLGLMAFKSLLTNYWPAEKSLEEFGNAAELIKNDELINTKIESIKHADDVTPGKPYIEICGPNAISGDTLRISDVINEGKPVLVDFWASWCGPCRKEIKNHLIDLYASGKVNIIGIAVWEKSLEDTQKAMEELGITWPVIFTGGRKNSPSIQYGVLGIPTLFLVGADGIIMGSGHSIDEIDFFNE